MHYGGDAVQACAGAASEAFILASALHHAWQAAAGAAGIRGWDAARPAEQTAQVGTCRDLFSPFRPAQVEAAWLAAQDGLLPQLAQAVYDERDPGSGLLDNARLAVLADALEETGCCDPVILRHCRRQGEHYRGCFVVDAILGKA
jgi:hypothetical protein